jgi:hypothetical protein
MPTTTVNTIAANALQYTDNMQSQSANIKS